MPAIKAYAIKGFKFFFSHFRKKWKKPKGERGKLCFILMEWFIYELLMLRLWIAVYIVEVWLTPAWSLCSKLRPLFMRQRHCAYQTGNCTVILGHVWWFHFNSVSLLSFKIYWPKLNRCLCMHAVSTWMKGIRSSISLGSLDIFSLFSGEYFISQLLSPFLRLRKQLLVTRWRGRLACPDTFNDGVNGLKVFWTWAPDHQAFICHYFQVPRAAI